MGTERLAVTSPPPWRSWLEHALAPPRSRVQSPGRANFSLPSNFTPPLNLNSFFESNSLLLAKATCYIFESNALPKALSPSQSSLIVCLYPQAYGLSRTRRATRPTYGNNELLSSMQGVVLVFQKQRVAKSFYKFNYSRVAPALETGGLACINHRHDSS